MALTHVMGRAAFLAAGAMLLAGCHRGAAAVPPPTTSPTGVVAVNKAVSDPVLGGSVTVLAVDREGDVLAVEVRLTAGTRVTTGIPVSAISVATANGSAVPRAALPSALPALATAQPGRSVTGWLAVRVSPQSGLTLRWRRAELTVVGSQQTVPATTYPIPLPAV